MVASKALLVIIIDGHACDRFSDWLVSVNHFCHLKGAAQV